jgi:glucose-1-phosphate adenylyltransferase
MSNTIAIGSRRRSRNAIAPLDEVSLEAGRAAGGQVPLIDIPISNCINSGMNRIYVLTQFMSVSLHRHIRRTYNFDNFSGGFVEILAAQQTNEKEPAGTREPPTPCASISVTARSRASTTC